MAIPIGAGAKLLKGAELIKDAATANEIMMGAAFYHDLYKEQETINPGKPLENHLAALLQSAVYMKINPAYKSMSGTIFKDVQPEIRAVVSKLASNEISGAAAKESIISNVIESAKRVGKIGEQSLNVATQMSVATGLNDAISGVFSGKFDADETAQKMAHTFESMALGSPLMHIGSLRGSNKKVVRDILYSVSEKPELLKEHIEKMAEQDADFAKQAPQLLKNLDHVTEVRKMLDENAEITENKKKDFLLTEVNKKILEDKIEKSPSKALNIKEEKQLAALEIEQKDIVDPMGSAGDS